MKRTVVLLASLAIGTLFASSVAFAADCTDDPCAGGSFRDDFDTFNSNRWLKSDHVIGRTDFDPDNAVVNNGQLRLRIPEGTTDGAEIESRNYYGYGIYRARIRTADAPTSLTGFFLYRGPDLYAEIDVEIYNDGMGNVDFVTYAHGQRTHHAAQRFAFDPSAGFHTYRFDYTAGSLEFYVDGDLVQTWTDGIPDASMKLLVNTWFPTWLAGEAPETQRATRVDWISYQR